MILSKAMENVRVGIVNTGWWADAMYLPALTANPNVIVTAVCGRNHKKATSFASKWQVPHVFTDHTKMTSSGLCDAIVVASHNHTHHEIAMAALEQGIHVLCEKPLAMNAQQAAQMCKTAEERELKTLVPFTYRFLPHARYIKQLIDEGYIGRPYHLNIRYYHAFGRQPGYAWSWDRDIVGAGDMGNLASHPIYLAQWYFGEIESVMAEVNHSVDRGANNPAGEPFQSANDNGLLILRFKNGALGSIHYSSVAHEKSCFDQHHNMEFHGAAGTIYHENDWVNKQETRGIREGDDALMPIMPPADIWGTANHPTVHESYKSVFRKDLYMIGEFINSILGLPIKSRTPLPDFADGLAVQKVIDAAMLSAKEGRRVQI